MLYSAAIPCFLEVAKEQNIAKAAEKLYISRQAVSKQIQRLEQDVGAMLFYRNMNQLSLTPAGRIYFTLFSEIMEMTEEAEKTVARLPRGDEVIRFGCIKGQSIERQMADLMKSSDQLPVDIHVIWGRDEPYLLTRRCLDHDFDIIINYDREVENPELESIPFLNAEFCLIAGKQLPGIDQLRDWRDLVNYPFMTWTLSETTDMNSKRGFQRLCDALEIAPKDIIVMSDMESMHTAVEMSSAVTIATTFDRLSSSSMVNVYPTGVRCNLCLAWRKDVSRPDVQLLLQSMKMRLSDD